jgi:endonuclease/exonuclease/phosphatase family metal-dependent hydrolase
MQTAKRFVLAAIWTTCPLAALAQQPMPTVGHPAIATDEMIPTIAWQDAADFMNREVFVVGKIVRTKRIPRFCFLDFHEDFANHLTLVIPADHIDNFPAPPNETYRDKIVKARGWISEFKGAPQMYIARPDQIQILDTMPDLKSARAAATPTPRAPSRRTDALTIATFNVENFCDAYDDPYKNDESADPKSRHEMALLAQTIKDIDADVLALQEVENRGILEEFNRLFLSELGYREVVLLEGNYVRGVDVALLTRLPVGPVTTYRHIDFPDANGHTMRFRRDLLRVRIEPPDCRPLDVFVVHLKSKSGSENGANHIRLGEARAARKIVDALLADEPDARFVVCGDFNDTLESDAVQTLIGSGPTALKSFHGDCPEPKRITYNREPYRSMIDFILCSPAMAKAYVPNSYRIELGTSDTLGSDHNPVLVQFKWADLKN